MKFLIKLFCLLSLVSSFAFSEIQTVNVLRDEFVKGFEELSGVEAGFLEDKNYFYFKSAEKNVYNISYVSFVDIFYYLGGSLKAGVYREHGDIFLTDGVYKNDCFAFNQSFPDFDVYSFACGDPEYNRKYTIIYRITLSREENYSCSYTDNFNTSTKQCVPACPAGQLWNVDTNSCVVDCSDEDNHKFFTNDYRCIDCSSALTADDIARCYCTGLGSSYNPGYSWDPDKPNILHAHCANETEIFFKFNKDKMKDKDNNSTNSSDKDKENPKPDKKDNNENSNNSSGESGNPSSNNSGGSSGNGSSGGGGTGVETKPNPNYKGDGKEDGKGDGKQDGKGEEGKGDDAVAQKLDYGDLEKDSDKFNSDFKDALDSVISQAQDFKNSLNDTISKIKDGGLIKFNQSAIPSTCPLNYKINLIYFEKDVTFDICKIISPASQILYYFFYVVFFVLFLIVTIKLFLFTF